MTTGTGLAGNMLMRLIEHWAELHTKCKENSGIEKADQRHFFAAFSLAILHHECVRAHPKIQRTWSALYLVSNRSVLERQQYASR